MAEFICNLKKYRLLKELTQEQLAEKVGGRPLCGWKQENIILH